MSIWLAEACIPTYRTWSSGTLSRAGITPQHGCYPTAGTGQMYSTTAVNGYRDDTRPPAKTRIMRTTVQATTGVPMSATSVYGESNLVIRCPHVYFRWQVLPPQESMLAAPTCSPLTTSAILNWIRNWPWTPG